MKEKIFGWKIGMTKWFTAEGSYVAATFIKIVTAKTRKLETNQNYNRLEYNLLEVGCEVNVTGITSGKGNGGNIKRHKFSRGPMSHGSKHHWLQGSLGAGTTPGRVFPGKRMPGRLGGDTQTLKGLFILALSKKQNMIVLKGSIPGKPGNLVLIRAT